MNAYKHKKSLAQHSPVYQQLRARQIYDDRMTARFLQLLVRLVRGV
jgi:hypothetical protein